MSDTKDLGVSSVPLAEPTASPCAARSAAGVLMERLEQASEGSQELDAAIAELVLTPTRSVRLKGAPQGAVNIQMYRYPDGSEGTARRYSVSLDAALTLVQSGYFVLRGEYSKPHHKGWIAETNGWSGYLNIYAEGATPALDLCIAALRAIQSTAETKRADGPDSAHNDNPNYSTGSVP